MSHRAILPGEQRFNEERWANDILNECYFNNRLWGYTIRIMEELQTCDPAVFTDGVLYNLMRMGIMDWTEHNVRMNQSTQAMRLATACQGHSHPKLSAPLRGSNCPLLASTELAW